MRWYAPTMDMNRKTNVYLHCMLSVSFVFILADSSTSDSFAGLAFFSAILKHRFFLLRVWERRHVESNQTDALASPLTPEFIVLFPCECRIQIFNRSRTDTPIYLYKNLHCFNFLVDYDAIGQMSGIAHTRISMDPIGIGWFCRLSIFHFA